MTPATHHGLLSAILSHRLPPILLNSTSKPTTRMGGKGYRSLSELQLKYSSGSESILSNLHDSLQRAAPILSQRDPHVVDRFARYEADARSYAQLPIHSETSLATFLHSFLLLPINLHLLAINDGHMPTLFWEASSSRETSAAPDFCLRLMEDRNYPDKPVIIGTIELKTATALSSTELMTLSKDFDDGKYIIDEDGRAVPADQAGLGPRRRVPKICHLLDQGHCHLAQLASKLALLTNYNKFVVLRSDGHSFQISDPVTWSWFATESCLATSPLGLLLGITVYATEAANIASNSRTPLPPFF